MDGFPCLIIMFWLWLLIFLLCFYFRRKCYGFFDFKCHIQYICMGWIVMFGLLLAIFPTGKSTFSTEKWIFRWIILQVQGLNCAMYFELQYLFCYGFYIRRDSLILFMIGGKIIVGLIMRVSGILEGTELTLTITTFMLTSITNRKWGARSIVLNIGEEAFTTIICITILKEEMIIISISIKFTRKSTSVGEVGIQVSCSKLVTIFVTANGERKEKWMKDYLTWLDTKRRKMNLTSRDIGF